MKIIAKSFTTRCCNSILFQIPRMYAVGDEMITASLAGSVLVVHLTVVSLRRSLDFHPIYW